MCIELILAILYFLTILVVNYFLYRLIKNYFTNILYLFKLKKVFTVYQKNYNQTFQKEKLLKYTTER